jgi:hypothetical protein
LRRNCLLKHVIEDEIEGRIQVTERLERRYTQLLNDLKKTREYWKLKQGVLYRTVWRSHFGKGDGPVVKTDYGTSE